MPHDTRVRVPTLAALAAGLLAALCPSQAQVLQVDFGQSVAAGPTQSGFEAFEFDDAVSHTLTFASAAATDGDIDVTISGNTHYRDYDVLAGGAFVGQSDLLSDMVLRNAPGTMTMTLGDLSAGSYQITTYHHSTQFGGGGITMDLTDSVVTNQQVFAGTVSSGTTPAAITSATFNLTSNGSDVSIAITGGSAGQHGLLNGFSLEAVAPDNTAPMVATLDPPDRDGGVRVDTFLTVTFDEPIKLGSGDITIKNLSAATEIVIAVTDATQAEVAGSNLTVSPSVALDPSAQYAVRISAGAIEDLAGNPFAGIDDDETWTFTTGAVPPLADQLCAYWPLDVVQGSPGSLTTPELISGQDLDLVNLDAGDLIAGQAGMAFAFSNADETMLTLVSDPGATLPISQYESFTISLWVNAAPGQPDLRFFSEASTTDDSPLVNIGTNAAGGMIDIFARDAAGAFEGHDVSIVEPLDGAGWRHVALAVNKYKMTFRVYIDGVADAGEFGFIDFYSADIDTTTIGGILRAEPTHWVTGGIDEVSVWKTALSPAQIATLAAGSSPIDLAGLGADFAITGIDYDPDGGAVTLTWRSRPGTTYMAFSSVDLSDWSNELADSLDADDDLVAGDGNQITVRFVLGEPLRDAPALFFRIGEEGQ